MGDLKNEIDVVPVKRQMRFLILALSCMAIFADYYILDIPAVISTQLVDYFTPKYGKDQAEIYYSFLYTIYSLPNVILPLFGGVLTDKIGYRKMTIVFIGFITLGQLITTVGMKIQSLELMIFGRFIFGIGGESINITISTLVVNWFQGSELSFAQSINLSMIRVATILNTFLTPRIAEKSMSRCFAFGVFVCGFSLVSSLLLVFLDYKLNRYDEIDLLREQARTSRNENSSIWNYVKSVFDKIKKSSKKFTPVFWSLTALMVSLYVTVVTFNTFSSSILIDIWLPKDNSIQQNQEIAGQWMSVPYIMASLLFPVFGLICDKYGQRVNLLIFSSILVLISFILLPMVYPVVSLAILGFSYAIFGAVIWPSVSYIVPNKRLGIGYGVMNSIQNIATALMPLVIAYIKVNRNSHIVIFTFLIISILSIALAIVLQTIDKKQAASLNSSDQEKLMDQVEKQSKKKYLIDSENNEFAKSIKMVQGEESESLIKDSK